MNTPLQDSLQDLIDLDESAIDFCEENEICWEDRNA
jgi:hypothetical protein